MLTLLIGSFILEMEGQVVALHCHTDIPCIQNSQRLCILYCNTTTYCNNSNIAQQCAFANTSCVFVLHCAEGRVTFLPTPHFCTLHTWTKKLLFNYLIPSRGFECACVFLVKLHRFIYKKNELINIVAKFLFHKIKTKT